MLDHKREKLFLPDYSLRMHTGCHMRARTARTVHAAKEPVGKDFGECVDRLHGIRSYRRGHTDYVNQPALTPKGEMIISASNDGLIKLWDGHIGPEIREFAAHMPPITSVAFSPSSNLVAADDGDGTVVIRKSPTYEVDTSVPEIGASAIVFVDTNTIAVGRNDGGVNICKIHPLERLCEFHGNDGAVVSLAYSAERQLIAAGTAQVNDQEGCMVKV